MRKIIENHSYTNTVKDNADFFKSYYFHSILDLNLVKLDYILQYGILCKALIKENQLTTIYTHPARDYDSKNGSTFISLSKYSDDTEFSLMFEAFTAHALSCVSLLVDKKIDVVSEGERKTYFDDEVFCYQAIPKSAISGIILPEHLTNLKIGEVCCLTSDITNYGKRYLENWITCMERYFGLSIDRNPIFEKSIELRTILDGYSRPERWVSQALETQQAKYGKDIIDIMAMELERLWSNKLGIDKPKYIEVIDSINKDQYPIYEIGKKSLKKIK